MTPPMTTHRSTGACQRFCRRLHPCLLMIPDAVPQLRSCGLPIVQACQQQPPSQATQRPVHFSWRLAHSIHFAFSAAMPHALSGLHGIGWGHTTLRTGGEERMRALTQQPLQPWTSRHTLFVRSHVHGVVTSSHAQQPKDVLEGEKGGGGVAGTPLLRGSPYWFPPKASQKSLSLNPLGAEAELWLSSSNIGRRGGGGGGSGWGGGYHPSSYGVWPF